MMNIEHDADKILRDLISKAEVAAKHSMDKTGSFPPTIFIHGIEGHVAYSPPVKFLNASYDDLALIAGECSVAYGAIAVVVAGEGYKVRTPIQRDNRVPDPAQSTPEDREEVVAIIGETRYEKVKKIRPIIRTEAGNFLGLGEGINVDNPGAFSNYADMLSKDFPDREARECVMAALYKEGHRIKEEKARWLQFVIK